MEHKLETDCWLWDGAKDDAGYGVSWHLGKFIRAHRLAYSLFVADIPEGGLICHDCDNRACVNPEHLYLGTNKQNSQDMVERNRQAKGEDVGTSKLKEEQVLAIRSSLLSSRKLAYLYNTSKTNVLDIKNKKIWRHI